MTDADLRVANTRLQSGGEVNPYTARHMGLFVVGRLAAQHGLVVRLRSTVAGEPNSGTTAGVYIPAELLLHGAGEPPVYGVPPDDPVFDEEPEVRAQDVVAAPEYRNGHADLPISLLPQRNPGASGISDIPSAPIEADVEPEDESDWPEQWPAVDQPTNGVHLPTHRDDVVPAVAAPDVDETPQAAEDPIFEKMLSEWLIDDPTELAKSTDLDWQTVWDHGWSAAAAAADAPVAQHTKHGLPMRRPGERLVPGAAGDGENGHGGRNGGAHRGRDGDDESTFDTGPIVIARDPEAVRSSIGNHFGGVHAGRAQARDSVRERWDTDHE